MIAGSDKNASLLRLLQSLGPGRFAKQRRSDAQSVSSLCLAVTGGIHEGARQSLATAQRAQWLIGSSLAGDLVLHDEGIQSLHLIVRIDPEGLELEACADSVIVDDQPLPCGGQVRFANDQLRLHDEGLRLCLGSSVRVEIGLPEQLDAGSSQPIGETSRRTARIGMAPWAAMCAIGAVAFGILGWQQSAVTPEVAPTAQQSRESMQRFIEQQPAWRGVRVSFTEGRRVELLGSVGERDALTALLNSPRVAAVRPDVKVVVSEELRRKAEDFLADPGLKVSVEGARIVLEGQPQRVGSRAALKLLKNELGERVEIVDRAVYEPIDSTRRTAKVELPVRIASVNIQERYFETTTGARYFEGARLEQGYVVESIEADRILFNVSGRQIEFSLK